MKRLIDRLYENVKELGHVCVGLDTDPDYLPGEFLQMYRTPADGVLAFNKQLIDETLDVAAVYKVQIAYYEAMGLEGLEVYAQTLRYLHQKGALVIADVKRGDIAKTAEMYAKAHFTGAFEADFITVNPFMGMDTLSPYLPYITGRDKGLFVLVATSNPGASDIEGLPCGDGETVSHKVGGMVENLGSDYLGECGYSALGAVVGCTNREQTQAIRQRMPGTFFLIPGYGAQGGTAQDMASYLRDGNGGVVNSSRGILLAWKKPEFAHLSFARAARAECERMRDDIRACL